MSRPFLVFALATTFLSLPALSAAAATLHHRHHPAAAPHPVRESHKHTHSPPSRRKGGGRPLEPYPGLYGSVDKCLRNMSQVCGREIFEAILGDDEAEVISRGCCLNLVAIGRPCHRKILKATVVLPEFSKRDRRAIRRRGAKVWGQCASVSDGLRFGNNSHYAPLPTLS